MTALARPELSILTPIWLTYACVNLEAFKSIHLNADVLH